MLKVIYSSRKYVVCFCMLYAISIFASKAYSQAISRAYYVSNTGSDNGTGSRKSPFKTISRINSVKFHAGDSILFSGGHSFQGTLVIGKLNPGISKKPFYISSYGKGNATIDGGNSSSILIDKVKSIKIRSLQLKGSGRKEGNSKDGIVVNECSNVTINNLAISGFQKAGLLINSSSKVAVSNVYAFENGFAGILIEGQNGKKNSKNILIKDCIAENNPGDPTVLNNHSGNGILVGHSTSVTIEYCVATNNGWDMPRIGNGPVGIWCYEADSVTIRYCISYKNKTAKGADDGGGFDLDGGVTNSIIEYCLSYENQGSAFGIFQYDGASPWYQNIIRNNVSENDGNISAAHASAYIWNSSNDAEQFKNLTFYKNILYNDSGAAIHYASESVRKVFSFYDNLFISKDKIVLGQAQEDSYLHNYAWSFSGHYQMDSLKNMGDANAVLKTNSRYKPIRNEIHDPHKLKAVIETQLSKYLKD
ncbi:MAG: right-handed parallel beta-helix repeat-containing protein [Ginsengibacter sp.]